MIKALFVSTQTIRYSSDTHSDINLTHFNKIPCITYSTFINYFAFLWIYGGPWWKEIILTHLWYSGRLLGKKFSILSDILAVLWSFHNIHMITLKKHTQKNMNHKVVNAKQIHIHTIKKNKNTFQLKITCVFYKIKEEACFHLFYHCNQTEYITFGRI